MERTEYFSQRWKSGHNLNTIKRNKGNHAQWACSATIPHLHIHKADCQQRLWRAVPSAPFPDWVRLEWRLSALSAATSGRARPRARRCRLHHQIWSTLWKRRRPENRPMKESCPLSSCPFSLREKEGRKKLRKKSKRREKRTDRTTEIDKQKKYI